MQERLAQAFEELLDRAVVPRADLERHPAAIYGLWPDGRLGYINAAWRFFAAQNAGEPMVSTHWHIGACIWDAVPAALRPFYRNLFAECLDRGRPVEHVYECSSPELLRRFHMRVYPLGDREGLLVVNSCVVEQPHELAEVGPSGPRRESAYRDEHGYLHQCCHCRRVQRFAGEDRWDWVPQWVERIPPDTTHVLCPLCYEYHYHPSAAAG